MAYGQTFHLDLKQVALLKRAVAVVDTCDGIGNAVGGAFGIMIMSAFGYVANAEQTAGALRGINITVNLIPAILFLVSAAACLLWDMTDADADEIRRKLANRHKSDSESERKAVEVAEVAEA